MQRPSSRADGLDHEAFHRARGVFRLRDNPLPDTAVHALAAEVVARLERRSTVAVDPSPHAEDIDALCDALVSLREEAAAEMVLQARLDGMAIDVVYLGYLAGAARELGNRWDEDRVTSAQMTIAAGRIYAIMRGLRQAFVTDQVLRPVELRALFGSVPGESHTLGVTMAADFFRRRGWVIDLRTGMTHHDLIASVPAESYSVIGLSAGSARMIFPLARLIVALRISNPAAWIMVSGKITDIVPDIVGLVDADGAAGDAETALEQMRTHVEATSQLAVARN
jgi:MerR family transcriptional regulator, light-induced transcriptional regulator